MIPCQSHQLKQEGSLYQHSWDIAPFSPALHQYRFDDAPECNFRSQWELSIRLIHVNVKSCIYSLLKMFYLPWFLQHQTIHQQRTDRTCGLRHVRLNDQCLFYPLQEDQTNKWFSLRWNEIDFMFNYYRKKRYCTMIFVLVTSIFFNKIIRR